MKDGLFIKAFVLAALLFAVMSAEAGNPLPELNGAWTNTGLLIRGQRADLPDPKLHKVSVFLETGLNHIFAWHDDRPGFCGWRALWSYDGETKTLSQRILAMDSRSAPDCAKDPTTQVGQEIEQPLSFVDGELRLTAEQDGEPVQTIWIRLENAFSEPPFQTPPLD